MGQVPATSPGNKSQGLVLVASCELAALVPATSPGSKSQGLVLVATCELAIFATKSSRKIWSLRL